LSGWCLSNSPVPYFPFLEALGSMSNENEEHTTSNSQLKAWLTKSGSTEITEKTFSLSPQARKDQTFATIIKELLFMSARQPTILFIDDLHWADSASLSLIHYIARAINSERIMVLATFRNEEILTKMNEAQPHPLVETLRLMGREGIFQEIELQKLSKDDVGKIAESMLNSKVSSDLVEKLVIESGGNPLFAVESLRMRFEQGSLVKEGGQWRLSDNTTGIPNKIKDVIRRRIDSLNSVQRRVLDAASVLGEKFDPNLVTDIVTQQNLDVLETLNIMEQSTHLVYCEGNYYNFGHAKIREWIYDSIPQLLRKEYHLRCAQTMENYVQMGNKIAAAEIALHYILAGNIEKSVSFSLTAGKDALARFSNNEAIKHFKYALSNLPKDETHSEENAVALDGLGDAYYSSNLFTEARATYEQLAAIETGAKKVRTLVKAMHPAFFQGDIPHLTELVKEAEACRDVERLEMAKVLLFKGSIHNLQCQFPQAIKYQEEALRIFEEEYALPNAAWLMFVVADVSSSQGQLERAVTLALRSITLYNELGDFGSQMEAYNEAGATFHNAGLTDQALMMYERVFELDKNTKMNNYFMLAKANLFSAQVWEVSDLQKAISKNLEALEYCKKSDSYLFIGMIYANLARLYTKTNDEKQADEYFDKLMKLPQPILTGMYTRVKLDISKAVYLAGKNQLEQSKQFLDQYFKFVDETFSDSKKLLFAKTNKAWILAKEGKIEQSETELKEVQTYIQHIQERFEPTNLQSSLMCKRAVEVNEDFEIRLDLINIGKLPGKLVKVESLVPLNLEIKRIYPNFTTKDGCIEFGNKTINGFEDQAIKIVVNAKNEGTITLNPKITYTNSSGEKKTCRPTPIKITVQPKTHVSSRESVKINSEETDAFEFRSAQAKKTFDFLIKVFIYDYMQQKIAIEKSGWCTLMEIAKKTNLPRSSFYGKEGRRGPAIAELERRGFVEARIFPGERGRGGKILRVRIDVEKTLIMHYIKNIIVKKG
jgi:tetratricopeptide (TPR) repeat protein